MTRFTHEDHMKIQAHFLILGFTAALTTACAGYRSLPSAAQPASLAADGYIRDTHELLHGVLWMQTAAEFWKEHPAGK